MSTSENVETVEAQVEEGKNRIQAVQSAYRDASNAFGASVSALVTGVIEFDKLLLSQAREVLNESVEHGKESFRAKNFKDLMSLQAGHVRRRIETTTSHVRELTEQSKGAVEDTFAPLREAATALRGSKAA